MKEESHPKTHRSKTGDPSAASQPTGNEASFRYQAARIELVVLPFSDYSSAQYVHLEGLRKRLDELGPDCHVRAIIVDTTRVRRCGAALAGILHSSAAALRSKGRRFAIVGDLHGILKITRLDEICPVFGDRVAAFRWCHNSLS